VETRWKLVCAHVPIVVNSIAANAACTMLLQVADESGGTILNH
jgi:hypothetical protein